MPIEIKESKLNPEFKVLANTMQDLLLKASPANANHALAFTVALVVRAGDDLHLREETLKKFIGKVASYLRHLDEMLKPNNIN